MKSFIQSCRGLKMLALWYYLPGEETQIFFASLRQVAPSHLSVNRHMLPMRQRHFLHPIFQDVTHLEVIWEPKDDWSWDSLSQLKRLTHLSLDLHLDSPDFVKIVRDVIGDCPPCLRVLVIWSDTDSYFYNEENHLPLDSLGVRAIARGDIDPRAVVAWSDQTLKDLPCPQSEQPIMRNYNDVKNDWAGLSAPGEDFWAQAERVIEGRMQRRTGKMLLLFPGGTKFGS
jgi:hypothetical protein